MWIRDCFPDALPIRETPCHCASTFTYLFMQICFHLSQLRWQGEAKCEVQQCECLQKKLTLKVSNEMKCPSDKYKRQRERAVSGEGRGGAQGDTPGNTPVTCRPNKIEIFKTTAQRVSAPSLPSLFPIPSSAFARVARPVGVVCVWGEWQWAWWWGRGCIDTGMTWRDFKFSNKQARQAREGAGEKKEGCQRIFKNV